MANYAVGRGWKKVAVLMRDILSLSRNIQQFAEPVYGKAGVHYRLTYMLRGTPDQTPQVSAAMYADAEGIHAVIVNGAVAVRDGTLTGRSPGATIRSGRDTVTPAMSPHS